MNGTMSVAGRRICDLARETAAAPDPEDALRTLSALRHELDDYERQQVAWALSDGRSYSAVARALGITRQAAHRRFKELAPPRRRRRGRMPATAEVRLVLAYARAEALALGSRALHPEHILLGILRNDDRRAAAGLRAAGITLETARLYARAHEGEGVRATKAALARAMRRAQEERAAQLGVDHLLRGVLGQLKDEPRTLLRALGVPAMDVVAELDRAVAQAPAEPAARAAHREVKPQRAPAAPRS